MELFMEVRRKKAFGWLLAFILAFACIAEAPVFARVAEPADAARAAGDSFGTAVAMRQDEEYDVSVEADGNAYYKFTPEESGTYAFHVTGGWISCYLHDEKFSYLDEDWGSDFTLSYELEGNQTYYINLSEESGEAVDLSISVTKEMLTLSYKDSYWADYGKELTLEVQAQSVRGAVSYQWYRGTVTEDYDTEYELIAGATKSSYTIMVEGAASFEYQCIVTDQTESKTAQITVRAETITAPYGGSLYAKKGEEVVLEVQAKSLLEKTLTYQWYYEEETEDGTEEKEIAGATESSCRVIADKNGDTYGCDISDGTQTITRYFTINLDTGLYATGQTTYYARAGEQATFHVKAGSLSGEGITYEWYDAGGIKIDGENRADCTVRATEKTAVSIYRCKISDGSKSLYMNFLLYPITGKDKEVACISPGKGWPTSFVFEEITKNSLLDINGFNKPLTVTYSDGTEKTINSGYCAWLDIFSEDGGIADSPKAYLSYMGKTASYDISIIKASESGTELLPGEKVTGRAGSGTAGRSYYSVPYPKDNKTYVVKLSELSGEGKGIVYSDKRETEFLDYLAISGNGFSGKRYFSVESMDGDSISYSVEVDTVENISEPVMDQGAMEDMGFYRAAVEKSGFYEVVSKDFGKNSHIAVVYDDTIQKVCDLYNQSTQYYLQAGETYYIENKCRGAKFCLSEEKSLPAGTKAGKEDGIQWNLTGTGTLTIEGEGSMPDNRAPWKTSAYYFGEDRTIKRLSVGNGVTAVSGLSNCVELEEIELPESLRSIGRYSFYGCTNLKWVTFPQSLTEIEVCAFRDCTSLYGISLPAGLKEIGLEAFYGCSSLLEVRLSGDGSFDYIGDSAFDRTAWADLQRDFVTLGGTLLRYKGNAQEVTIPDSVKEIGVRSFAGSSQLTKITMSGTVNKIWEYGFAECKNLKEIRIPGNVSEIVYGAFSGCTALENAVLEEGVKSVGHDTFLNNDSLKTASLPNSLAEIGSHALGYVRSSGFRSEYKKSETPPQIICHPNSTAHQYAIQNGLPFVFADQTGSAAEKTVDGNSYIITEEGTAAFAGTADSKAKKVKIPSKVSIGGREYNVTIIADQAFLGASVTNVTIGSNVQEIGEKAFFNCKKLKKIVIPSKVRKIGKNAFGNCKKLKNITVKTTKLTKKSVGANAFKGIAKGAVFKVPKNKFSSYKKLFRKKGVGNKARYRK